MNMGKLLTRLRMFLTKLKKEFGNYTVQTSENPLRFRPSLRNWVLSRLHICTCTNTYHRHRNGIHSIFKSKPRDDGWAYCDKCHTYLSGQYADGLGEPPNAYMHYDVPNVAIFYEQGDETNENV